MNIIKWDLVKEKIKSEKWAKDIYSEMKTKLDEYIATYHDDVNNKAGWGHHFTCKECSGALIFDVSKPNEHTCRICGKVNSNDEDQNNAWTATYRGLSCSMIYSVGVVYNIEKDEKYLSFVREVLNFLSENYDDFNVFSPGKRFEGRITGINLSDAIAIIKVIFGLDMLEGCFNKEELAYWHKNLFMKQAEMYDQFSNKLYNIPMWMKCAEGIIGIYFNDEKIINNAFYSRFGVMDQLRRGVTDDGMWFEASTHYHYYTVEAVIYLIYFAKRHDLNIKDKDELYKYTEDLFMFTIKNCFSNGLNPAPSDCWPEIYPERYRTQWEYAAALFDKDVFKQVVGTFYKGKDKPTISRLLFNEGYESKQLPQFGSFNFEDSFSAILKNKNTEAYIKTGIKTICHAHPDVMNIELCMGGDLVSKDLGSSSYSSKVFVEWQRHSICHNTIILDKKDQEYVPIGEGIWPEGIVEYFDDTRIKAKAKNVYECVDYIRELKLDENVIYDDFEVKGVEDSYTMDWAFYCKGDVKFEYDYKEVDAIGDKDGYQHLFDIKEFNGDDDWTISFELEDKIIKLDMKGLKGTKVYIVNSYTKDLINLRFGVIVRREAKNSIYNAKYTYIDKRSK